MKITVLAVLLAGRILDPVTMSAWQPAPDDLTVGINQVHEGDFEAAVVTLDGVARRLARDRGQVQTLARAYMYLAIAYVGLAQEAKAKAAFLEALKADAAWNPTTAEFPSRIIDLFNEARTEAVGMRGPEGTPPTPSPLPTPAMEAKDHTPPKTDGHGGHAKIVLLALGVAAAAGGIAVASGGGGGQEAVSSGPSPPLTPTPAPTPAPAPRTETFSGLLTAVDSGPYHDNYHVVTVGASGTLQATMNVVVTQAPGNNPYDVGIFLWLYAGRRDYGNGTGEDTVARDSNADRDTYNQTYRLTAAVTPGTYTLRAWCLRIGAVYASYTLQVTHP